MNVHGSVLIVDRDSELASILSSYLSTQGYRVVFTTRVREALKKLMNQRFEHVFIDPWLEPDKTEDLFIDLMTSGTMNNKTPITLMTHDLDYQISITTSKRIMSILPKPFSLPEFSIQLEGHAKAKKAV